jgi:protein O-GlcNAcase / histone acetyltransferase
VNPNFRSGVVEGFYGRPWTFAQRHQVVGWLQRFGLNTYLHAPKDDLKHRVLWRKRLDTEEAADFKKLLAVCNSADVRFIYSIAPGWDGHFAKGAGSSSKSSLTGALKRRFRQLLELGCRDFAVMFDDVPNLPPEKLANIARRHADLANELWQWLDSATGRSRRKEAQIKLPRQNENRASSRRLLPTPSGPAHSLALCPAVYCTRMAGQQPANSAYLRALGKHLHPGVDIFWTGSEIISPTISPDHLRDVATILRRPPFIWDNLHANDYDNARIFLGPFSGRTHELPALSRGVVLNPNGACALNFLPLATLGEFVRRGEAYNPESTVTAAIEGWLPEWERVTGGRFDAATVRLLVDCFWLPFAYGPQAVKLLDAVRDALCAPPKRLKTSLPRVKQTAERLGKLFFDLGALKNRDLFDALWPHVWRLKDELGLVVAIGEQRRQGKHAPFVVPDHPAGVFRGGPLGELRELIQPVKGGFRSRI